MAKDKDKSNKKSSAASAKAEVKAVVTANPRLVAAFRSFEESKQETRSRLIAIAEITQEEQLTRAEQVASYMEAYGCEKSTAESQISRMGKILSDPETLEELKAGRIDLKTARERTAKKQAAPSAKKKEENLEKRLAKAVSTIVEVAKESGMDLASVVNTVKSALKKAGVR